MNNTKNTTLVIIAVVAAVLVMGPVAMSVDNYMASAHERHHHHHHHDHDHHHHHHHDKHGNHKSNHANQEISQKQSSSQHSQVVSGGSTLKSGNNLSFEKQFNKGNEAAGQR